MLGEMLIDPFSVEAREPRSAEGLAYLPVTTTFLKEKTTVRVHGTLALEHSLRLEEKQEVTSIEGYEIHMGETDCIHKNNVAPLFQIVRITGEHVHEGWATLDGATWGTYLHGVFHNDTLRRSWLDGIRVKKGLKPFRQTYSSNMLKEQEFDRIAEVVRNHVDMEQIYAIMGIK